MAAESQFVRIKEIIDAKSMIPKIVNEESKFVIITYWWGNENLNYNTARPCTIFFEGLIFKAISLYSRLEIEPSKIWLPTSTPDFHWGFANKMKDNKGNSILSKFYIDNYKGFIKEYTKYKQKQGISEDIIKAELKTKVKAADEICKQSFINNLDIVKQLHTVVHETYILRKKYELLKKNSGLTEEVKADIRRDQERLKEVYNEIQKKIKIALRPYIIQLRELLMYKQPISYKQMIANWEEKCAKVKCNYLAVEYPEFAAEGGYQLAINAKPLFIQKALKSCGGRAVVYIDGDMTVNMYPAIFDLPDVDYMARGWGYDPRSSSRYQMEITVDPYTFETSGGIMYFSTSPEAKRLADLWVAESARPSQAGKADDRIISLIFNSQRLLAPLKIIQLPIEYLWLTLAYDEWVEDTDGDYFIEHPECLTSEDTASAGGASSNRQPLYYEGIGEAYPRSEDFYSTLAFPSKKYQYAIQTWLDYMHTAKYAIDETNPDIVEETKDTVALWKEIGIYGKKPFNIYEFDSTDDEGNDNKFGPYTENYRKNMAALASTPDLPAESITGNIANMDQETFTIPNILKQLELGRDVYYKPNIVVGMDESLHARNAEAMESFLLKDMNKRIELVFTDSAKSVSFVNIFYYNMDLSAPIYIRNNTVPFQAINPQTKEIVIINKCNPILFKSIAFFNNVQEMSTQILNKQYQILSRIRVQVFNPIPKGERIEERALLGLSMMDKLGKAEEREREMTLQKAKLGMIGGGDGNENSKDTTIGFNAIYGPPPMVGGRRRRPSTHKHKGGKRKANMRRTRKGKN